MVNFGPTRGSTESAGQLLPYRSKVLIPESVYQLALLSANSLLSMSKDRMGFFGLRENTKYEASQGS